MLKLSIRNGDIDCIQSVISLPGRTIKSKQYYKGFDQWLLGKVIPNIGIDRDVISCRCKKYDTLLGFAVIKYGNENKLCNLSPMVDGVGLTQALLESSHLFFTSDYSIDVPLINDTTRLRDKLLSMGFDQLDTNISNDNTNQITYKKARNICWI